MRFIVPYPYAMEAIQNAENCRQIVDGLFDGQHDVRLNTAIISTAYISTFIATNATIGSANITDASITSANITSAVIGSAIVTSGSAATWYANLLLASSLRIQETPTETSITPWQPDKYLQIATNFWCPVISATL